MFKLYLEKAEEPEITEWLNWTELNWAEDAWSFIKYMFVMIKLIV